MPEVEVAVNVMASPSQNVEDDADDAKAVDQARGYHRRTPAQKQGAE